MRLKTLLTLTGTLLLAACVQTTLEPAQNPTRKTFTSVSTGSGQFHPKVGQSVAWYTPPVTWGTTGPTDLNPEIESAIIETAEAELIKRGFVIVENTADSDFIIGAVLATGDYNQTGNFAQYFNVNANLNSSNSSELIKAFVGIVDSQFAGISPPPKQALLWKADLETEILEPGTDKAIRIARAKALTLRLLSSLPSAQTN